jgi:hypothetical protein
MADRKLRRKWKIKGLGRIPLTVIATRAYPEDPKAAKQHMINEVRRARRRINPKPENDVSVTRRKRVKGRA